MQFSRVRTKSESDSLMMWRLLAFSMFLIHLLAWPWGSIINGQRRELLKTSQHTLLRIRAKSHKFDCHSGGKKQNPPFFSMQETQIKRLFVHHLHFTMQVAKNKSRNIVTYHGKVNFWSKQVWLLQQWKETNHPFPPRTECTQADCRIAQAFHTGQNPGVKFGRQRAKLLPDLMMMPFSVEKLSVGRPAMFQARILTGSPRVLIREKSGEHGRPFSTTVFSHSAEPSWMHTFIWLAMITPYNKPSKYPTQ